MKSPLHLVLAALLFAQGAFAASRLEAMRASAQSARQQVSSLKSRQMELRKELNEVASRIEALKASRQGKLLSGGELDAALRRSQELSGALTELARSVATAEAAADKENLALLESLSDELKRLRAEFDRQTDREKRQKLIEQMRQIRAERDNVRAQLQAASVPPLQAPSTSEDPEDLLEEADRLRDSEDKVRRQLEALEKRIAEKREEREFDRRMHEFLGDESIFDDQDRRFRVRRDSVERTTTSDSQSGPDLAAGAPAAEASEPSRSGFNSGLSAPPANPATPAKDINQNEKAAPQSESVVSRSARASDGRIDIGQKGQGIAGGSDDDLDDLEVQRQKLRNLAEELKARAKKLEERANQLR